MDNIINLFINEQNSSYNNLFRLYAIIIIIVIVYFFIRFSKENQIGSILLIMAISFGIYISNIYVKNIQTDINDTNKITLYKLDTLQSIVNKYIKTKLSLKNTNGQKIDKKDQEFLLKKNKLADMYIDANLIHFLFSIQKLNDYNPSEFYLLLKGTNNILKIRNEIETFYNSEGIYTENIHEMFEMALQLKTKCLNNLQNMIYLVPKISKMYTYIEDSIDRYYQLVQKNLFKLNKYHLDDIEKNGINNRSKFIYMNQTKGIDPNNNHTLMSTKNSSHKLIDLYV